ncbi:PH domain-containing protein [Streptomyces apocyni]|uniref:PH domain-containing protein n=1 Tax=Streptomyces apocyni TaxID=2654677 RepID=UPI0012EA560E|nr:PH domain-containing protein [Streptomyces apocyni]
MTSSDRQPTEPAEPAYADRAYRSGGGIVGGVLILALGAWLGGDALIRGEGRVPWVALAALVFAVPLVVAYTVRPAVFANNDRLRVRNPFRVITLPWASVEGLRSGYTTEVYAKGGTKYQVWAIPVSIRARKKARKAGAGADKAPSDEAVTELNEIAEREAKSPTAQGDPEIRWAYEILIPAAAGAALLGALLLIG